MASLATRSLDPRQRRAFARDGFLVVPGFKAGGEVAALRRRAAEIVEAFDPAEAHVFSTREASHARDDYFLSSGETIRCFLEEDAFDVAGRLKQSKALSINKIGHAMHDLDPVFERFSRDARLEAIARDLGLLEPRVYQSMYIFKQPRIGGEVRWHQDASFFRTDPQRLLTFWFALEDADRENGCLWVEPGGHRSPLRERFVVSGAGSRLEPLDSTPWPPLEAARALEVPSGALVVFDGLLPHYSAPNRSARSRHAYTLHAVDARTRYLPENWLQRAAGFPARGFA